MSKKNVINISDFKATVIKLAEEYDKSVANTLARKTEGAQVPATIPPAGKPIGAMTEREYRNSYEEGYGYGYGYD